MNDSDFINKITTHLNVTKDEFTKILEKAKAGGETNENITPADWIIKRLLPNCVFIDENDYAEMCVDALKILGTTAATDYGSSRQRDLGQLWADMTRGYLGEKAFSKFLLKKFKIETKLGHEVGTLEEYLPSDISEIQREGEGYREPKKRIGIKTTKWNGIWLDLPGDQFNHSDYHIFVKVGTGRDHLFSFFKLISVFKDKVLKIGVDVGSLSKKEAGELFDKLPSFTPITAYICGFVRSDSHYEKLSYSGKMGRLHFKIQSWNGPINSGDLEKIKELENVSGNITFEGIGKFSHDSGYLFNTGSLSWRDEEWLELVQSL